VKRTLLPWRKIAGYQYLIAAGNLLKNQKTVEPDFRSGV